MEQRASEFLEAEGFRILARNWRCRTGEIDIIAKDGKELVFVEVKYRKNREAGFPEESVTIAKQRTICRCALCFLLKGHYSMETPCRFDVIAIDRESIRHHRNAFPFVM